MPRSLEQIQRWMQSVIMHPEGVPEGVASDDARGQIDVSLEKIESVLTRSKALSAAERLAIYSGAYHARLLECLREEFPVLMKAFTQEVFDAFAVGYLQKYPSHSYTLGDLGRSFPRYLEETRPQEDEEDGGSWPDFLVDLATLEQCFNDVFDGPGVEGQKLLEVDQLLAIPPSRWPDARLLPVPCLRLLTLRYPVHKYYATARQEQDPIPPEPATTRLAVSRRQYVVHHFELAGAEHTLLQLLTTGHPVGDAIAATVESGTADYEEVAANLQGWFRNWTARGFFASVELPK